MYDAWKQFLNKRVKIVFEDIGKASMRHGIFTGYNSEFIFLDSDEMHSQEAIAISKVVRVELEDNK